MGAVGYRDPSEKIPHKHAELIKAWAENQNLVFQVRAPSAGRLDNDWATIGKNEEISWIPDLEYRIKPEPKPDLIVNAMMEFKHEWKTPKVFTSWNGDVIPAGQRHTKNIDWIEHIRFIFDGETGKLKHVEIIK